MNQSGKLSYRIKTLSQATDISASNLKKAIYRGDLRAAKEGTDWLILAEDAMAYLRSLPVPQMKKAQAGNQSLATAIPAHACGD
ncbi:MAG TPA: hypothetical protein VFS27_04565 [Blastocatellia bacterium]|nr:hypothetical protein [Blastocatellia bacterium]